jgi:nucleotide-binding universal stress UspA family protein
MDWKTILVQLSNPRRAEVLMSVAGRIAERFNSHLIGLNVAPSLMLLPMPPMPLAAEALDAMQVLDEEDAKKLKTTFDDMTRSRAFVAEWRDLGRSSYDLALTVMEHGRASDLIVASQIDPEWTMTGAFDFPDRLALESGRPVLIVPYAGTYGEVGKRIMIAWSGKREGARAVFDALPLLKGAEAVTLLCVVGKGTDAEPGDLPGAEIAATLARHGVKVTVQKSHGEEIGAADEILSRLADSNSDLLVMGAYGHSRLREMVFGGVTRHILRHMTVPTLMSH